MADIDIDLLRRVLRYEPETGKLTWRHRTPEMFSDGKYSRERRCSTFNALHADCEAFTSDDGNGYLQGTLFFVGYRAHRVVWALHYGYWPIEQIDHINGIRSDNRLINLRSVSSPENNRNQKLLSTNSSGTTGVSFDKRSGKWEAYIGVNGKRRLLGYFAAIAEAKTARKNAEVQFGYHANHGRAV